MTSRHARLTTDGLTHASSVIPFVKCNDAASGMFTRAFTPLNTNALPNFPALVYFVFSIVPVLPAPAASAIVLPVPSLNHYATTTAGNVDCAVALPILEYALRFPDASVDLTW